jgi:hypothetical protein
MAAESRFWTGEVNRAYAFEAGVGFNSKFR